jgi:hypothetical protein
MAAMGRRLSAAALVVALFTGLTATAAEADPTPAPTPQAAQEAVPPAFDPPTSLPGRPIGAPPGPADQQRTFEYVSLEDLRYLVDARALREADVLALLAQREWKVGSENHLLVAWYKSTAYQRLQVQLEKLEKKLKAEGKNEKEIAEAKEKLEQEAFEKYVTRYITVLSNLFRGQAYEALVAREFGIRPEDVEWHRDERFPDTTSRRRGDLWNLKEKLLVEIKSGNSISESQLRAYQKEAVRLGLRLVIVFRQEPNEDTVKAINKINEEIAKQNETRRRAGKAPLPYVIPRQLEATDVAKSGEVDNQPAAGTAAPGTPDPGGAVKASTPPKPKTGPPGALAAPGQAAAASPATTVIGNSPDSEEDAADFAELEQVVSAAAGYSDADDAGLGQQHLGGVDFATLELRYVADTYDGGVGAGVRYAYQVEPKPGTAVSFGGQQSARLAADSFFTWLSLPPSSFTVNLNPDEPNRIIDRKLGTTDAGRVLLEADLQMKKTVAKLINPNDPAGLAFWKGLRGETSCLQMRQWIVPKPAVVHEQDNELFILDAPLDVKMETDLVKTPGAASSADCPNQAASDTRHNEALFRTTILPKVQQAVNTAPEYADLRRAYVSRVAAEWYRQRSAKKATAYKHLVDSGDVSAWPARTPWSPREVFDRYVKSYTDGEFKVERTTQQGNQLITHVYVYGGVDFKTVPKRTVTDTELVKTRPGLRRTTGNAAYAPSLDPDRKTLWMGGQSTERPLSAPLPPPASPLRRPAFYLLVPLPVLCWLAIGGFLLLRRRRAAAAIGTGVAP